MQVNTILNVAATLDDETVVKSICEILEIDYEEIKSSYPQQDDGVQAQVTLNGVVTEIRGYCR